MKMIDFAKMHHRIYALENPKGLGKTLPQLQIQ